MRDRLWGAGIPSVGNEALIRSIGAFFGSDLSAVRFRRDGILPYIVPFHYSAVVIGNNVNIRRGAELVLTNPRIMAEEMFHVVQWRQMGPIRMSITYVWHHLRRGYAGNPIERQAKQQADAFCAFLKAESRR
ncbi:MAG: hypothetical protein JW765_06095 [Deltaproteobacteria bacterium]|nr:hypothetical protein [Candidatus Zymogenaceae bacterium]